MRIRSPRKSGSSPRLRGTETMTEDAAMQHRFIPAPAGNGWSASCSTSPAPVHPRACGERYGHLYGQHYRDGSSPRLRGTGRRRTPAFRIGRFIPRLRGTASGVGSHPPDHRFIPAPAGNGPGYSYSEQRTTVHPRACGERSPAEKLVNASTGSSPRLRGTEHTPGPWMAGIRFIPAPAGNGPGPAYPISRSPVHPRACGERCLHTPRSLVPAGSSPRLRGTADVLLAIHAGMRFIPAPAGNGTSG